MRSGICREPVSWVVVTFSTARGSERASMRQILHVILTAQIGPRSERLTFPTYRGLGKFHSSTTP